MIQINKQYSYKEFISNLQSFDNNMLVFMINNNDIQLQESQELQTLSLPTVANLKNLAHLIDENSIIIKWTYDKQQNLIFINNNIISFNNLVNIKYSKQYLSHKQFELLLLAKHLTYWYLKNKYCGMCANKMTINYNTNNLAIKCNKCNNIVYPSLSPVAIGLIYHHQQILLAKSIKNINTNIYGCIAGYTTLGETIEETLKRETYEEVGVFIKNISYINSQYWPFPDSLMFGFIAEYDSGIIKIDKTELIDAAWFSIDKLPDLPPKTSISYMLIEHYLKNLHLYKQ